MMYFKGKKKANYYSIRFIPFKDNDFSIHCYNCCMVVLSKSSVAKEVAYSTFGLNFYSTWVVENREKAFLLVDPCYHIIQKNHLPLRRNL